MIINMIRHGLTAGNLEKRYIGKTDEPLCSEGLSVLKERAYPAADVLITSPMKRCLETARAIYPGIQPIVFPELSECDFGKFEGKNYHDLTGDADYQRWIDSGGTLPFPGGESPEEFRARCCSGFLRALHENQSANTLTFIVHGGTIMSIMEKFAVPHHDYFDWQCANGSGFSAVFLDNKLTSISEL